MRPDATHLKRTAGVGLIPQALSPRFDQRQPYRVGSEFFVGLAVAMPLSLLLWAVVVSSVWLLMR
jgi:hypothetical protein